MAKYTPPQGLFDEYEAFVEKFQRKKTTDDCYTPPAIYDIVLDWARHNLPRFPANANIVRPFYPGEDYKARTYEDNDVVVDNPPFSIISQITNFYIRHNIPFLLFAPTLSLFWTIKDKQCSALVTDAKIVYNNGAVVNTSFVTNMDSCNIRFRTTPDLKAMIKAASPRRGGVDKTAVAKVTWPGNVASAALITKLSRVNYLVTREDSAYITTCGGQRLYGSGYLLSTKAAAEKAAAEKAAAEKATIVKLTMVEEAIIAKMDRQHSTTDQTTDQT